ncbi:2Fe-2S iron-sulfur cluster-binding protein [Hyphococcus sp.]|uniref:2Fe-2S iron-sulfur cluster-binding protein n=1 Tax=Hyphococcus sp. TaxID=2038636 RepID=UPI0035C75F99
MTLVRIPSVKQVYECRAEETILAGMVRLGGKAIFVGCQNGGCGVCKIRVVSGEWRLSAPMSRAWVSIAEERDGEALACRVVPRSDMEIEVLGSLMKSPARIWDSSQSGFAPS